MEKPKTNIVETEACCGSECCSSGNEVNTSDMKQEIRKQYGKIALSNGTKSCCGSECCSPSDVANNPIDSTKMVGYSHNDLQSIPEASILGVGCGAPLNFAEPKDGEIVVDLGSGAGIDVFLSANRVGNNGKVIGIDMTDEMLEKSRANAKQHGYNNVEFRKGDIEQNIPVENDSVDLVISNCVINLTADKTEAFKQVHRILKSGGRTVISDMVTDKEVAIEFADAGLWCGCIDGALTKEHYIDSIKQAGFSNVEVLQERPYNDGGQLGGRKMSSIILRAVK